MDSVDVQVAIYSGLKLNQLSILINAFEFGPKSKNPGMKPLDVVIMAGINDMGLAPTSNKSSLHRILTSLKSQFPGSRFSFCQVPIKSGMFKKTEVETIEALNKEIERLGKIENINVIPKIHDDDFEVDPVKGGDVVPKLTQNQQYITRYIMSKYMTIFHIECISIMA